MSDIDQSHIAELQTRFDNINQELMKLSRMNSGYTPVREDSNKTAYIATAYRLKNDAKNLANTMYKGTGSLSSYSRTVSDVSDTISSLLLSFGKFSKIVSTTIQLFSALATRFLDGSQEILKSSDSLTKYSMNLGMLPTELRRQAHASQRFHTKNIEQFVASLQTLGGASLYLSNTTAAGASEFNKIATVSKEVTNEFVMLGVEPSKLREHFAQYIANEAKLGLQRFRGTERERQRALDFTKNLYAMSALTGESVDELQQKYQSLLNDVQFNTKLTNMRREGKSKQADNIQLFLTNITSIMGESTAKAYKDLIVNNGAALVKESQGELASTFGKASHYVYQLVTDRNVDISLLTNEILEQKGEAFGIFGQALQFASNEEAANLGMNAKAVAAAQSRKAGKSLDQIQKDAERVAKSSDHVSTARAKQLEMEAVSNIALDKLANIAEAPMIGAFTILHNTVKIAAKTFAWAAGAFGFKDVEKNVNDLFETPEQKQRDAEKKSEKFTKLTEEIEDKSQKVASLQQSLNEKRKSGKHTEAQLRLLEEQISKESLELEKLRKEYVQSEIEMREAWKKYNQTPEGVDDANRFSRTEHDSAYLQMGDLISEYESKADGYSALVNKQQTLRNAEIYDSKNGTNLKGEIETFLVNIDKHSIAEVLDFQKKINKLLKVGTAIGRYQYIYSTLKEKATQMEAKGLLKMSDLFDASTQDKILRFHLNQLGFEKVRTNKATAAERQAFIGRLGGTWAGIGINEKDENVHTGKNGNRAQKGSYKALQTTLDKITSTSVEKQKFKIGGIASGPKSGYEVELHGTEAIIPMQKDSVPVMIGFPALELIEVPSFKISSEYNKISNAISKLKAKKEQRKKPEVQSTSVVVSNAVANDSLETLLELVREISSEVDKSTNALETAAKYIRV